MTNVKIKFEKDDLANLETFNTINDLSLNDNIIKNQLAFSGGFFEKKEMQEIYTNLMQLQHNKQDIHAFLTKRGTVPRNMTYIYPKDNTNANLKTISPNMPEKLLLFEKCLFEKFDILKLTRIQIVNSVDKTNDISKIPFCLHTDRLLFIRVMIYLTDVHIENGPLHVLPLNSTGLEKIIKYKDDFYKKYKEWRLMPYKINTELKSLSMEGPIGSIVLWNGNIPHKAGVLKDNKIRKVIILEYETQNQYDWRKKNNIIPGKNF